MIAVFFKYVILLAAVFAIERLRRQKFLLRPCTPRTLHLR